MISSRNSKCICSLYLYDIRLYGERRTPFSNWKENMWRVWCYDPNMYIWYTYGISVSGNTDEYGCSYYTYLGIHILFGKVMSRILWAVVLLSSKLSLTEIYIAAMTYKWNFQCEMYDEIVNKIFLVLRFTVSHYSGRAQRFWKY